MNLLDALLLLLAVGAVSSGYRHGLVSRASSWIGLTAGAVVGVSLVDDLVRALQDESPRTRLLAAMGFLFLVALAGQMLGLTLHAVLRRYLPGGRSLQVADRVAGGAAGLLAVLVALWLLTPVLAHAPGWPARAIRGSAVARALDRIAPEAPTSLATLGRLLAAEPFPEVFERLTSPNAGEPPRRALAPEVAARVTPSVVRVEGEACGLLLEGSGYVAASDVVVTNAHVVAGERSTHVITEGGRRAVATVVAFDSDRDVAVLRVQGLELGALSWSPAEPATIGAVIGYPGGGPQEVAPARLDERVTADGTDIYRTTPTVRDVLVLAARLVPGYSGGPFVDEEGGLVGLAFAVDPGRDTTAYALTRGEVDAVLRPVLVEGATATVATGPCLVG